MKITSVGNIFDVEFLRKKGPPYLATNLQPSKMPSLILHICKDLENLRVSALHSGFGPKHNIYFFLSDLL